MRVNTDKIFADDVKKYGTYVYAGDSSLSIILSSKRRCRSILSMEDFAGKTILDIGCGDGIYTYDLSKTNAALVVGIDPIEPVISYAQEKFKDVKNLRFECADLYKMEVPEKKYDIAILRGVLHHVPDLEGAISKTCLMAKKVIVLEPNGYNPILKIIEKTSAYHVEHDEKSFAPYLLRREFERNGAKIIKDEYISLVPTFCSDFVARICKFFEPLVEKLPVIKNIACGQYVFVAEISNSPNHS